MPGKIGSAWFVYKKWQVIKSIYKLFPYNFWLNCLKFSDKMDMTIQMKVFKNIVTQFARTLETIFLLF